MILRYFRVYKSVNGKCQFTAKLESTDKDESELFNFDASPLTFVMINAIKEQQKQIEALQSKVRALQETIQQQQLAFEKEVQQ